MKQEKLTSLEQELIDILPRGKGNARTARELTKLFSCQLSLRVFYGLIESLRKKGILIGASRTDPKGYYLVSDEEEKQHFLAGYEAQVKQELLTLEIMKQASL
ncbi:hypothetical protein [Aerococcus sp. Group 1]|uniref:hypothetical protein n=1 Tax=Aerococcus urinae (strain CCUG 59500 / ACS-120-V-Col10a) TaxID=2976812 RepID=UPI00227B9B7A|nr:hypothetical protein [Aerococcus sp. Group 1]MCY3031370.1 hypothetical protein [Aerococcus sp. Group 1]